MRCFENEPVCQIHGNIYTHDVIICSITSIAHDPMTSTAAMATTTTRVCCCRYFYALHKLNSEIPYIFTKCNGICVFIYVI